MYGLNREAPGFALTAQVRSTACLLPWPFGGVTREIRRKVLLETKVESHLSLLSCFQ